MEGGLHHRHLRIERGNRPDHMGRRLHPVCDRCAIPGRHRDRPHETTDFPEIHFCIGQSAEIVGPPRLKARQGSGRNRPHKLRSFAAEIDESVLHEFRPVHIQSRAGIFALKIRSRLERCEGTVPVCIHLSDRSVFFPEVSSKKLPVVARLRIVVGRLIEQLHAKDLRSIFPGELQTSFPMLPIELPAGRMKHGIRHPVSAVTPLERIDCLGRQFFPVGGKTRHSRLPRSESSDIQMNGKSGSVIQFNPGPVEIPFRINLLQPGGAAVDADQIKTETIHGLPVHRHLVQPFQRLRIPSARLQILVGRTGNHLHSDQITDFSIHQQISIRIHRQFRMERHLQPLRNLLCFREHDLSECRNHQK